MLKELLGLGRNSPTNWTPVVEEFSGAQIAEHGNPLPEIVLHAPDMIGIVERAADEPAEQRNPQAELDIHLHGSHEAFGGLREDVALRVVPVVTNLRLTHDVLEQTVKSSNRGLRDRDKLIFRPGLLVVVGGGFRQRVLIPAHFLGLTSDRWQRPRPFGVRSAIG